MSSFITMASQRHFGGPLPNSNVAVNIDHRGNATIPLGRVSRTHSPRIRTQQHGSASVGRSHRDRSSSRDRNAVQPVAAGNYRMNPVGPMEQQDWLDALRSATNRIDTLERAMTQHTQAIVNMEQRQEGLSQRHQTFSTTLSTSSSHLEHSMKVNNETIVTIYGNFNTVGENSAEHIKRPQDIDWRREIHNL